MEQLPHPTVNSLPHDRSWLLANVEPTTLFHDSMDRWINAMIADEHGGGESSEENILGEIRAKANGIIAGTSVADRLVVQYFPDCTVTWNVTEGEGVQSGEQVLKISGPAVQVLRCERIMLNILGRMSGIATNTASWVSQAGNIGVACTRKTDWGLLDKWAVHVGGGLTHRLSRADALMIKENDLAALAPGIDEEDVAVATAVSLIDMDSDAEFTVIEVRDSIQAVAAVKAWDLLQIERSGCEKIVLLLDNMGPSGCAEVHRILMQENLRAWCILEGSGGVVLEELGQWTESGVDLVSTSALNRGVSPLDLSMKVVGGD
tara:strand:- start:258 stop:1214 length:957 start_codon:yes stop_codon:yes gene_type:complete